MIIFLDDFIDLAALSTIPDTVSKSPPLFLFRKNSGVKIFWLLVCYFAFIRRRDPAILIFQASLWDWLKFWWVSFGALVIGVLFGYLHSNISSFSHHSWLTDFHFHYYNARYISRLLCKQEQVGFCFRRENLLNQNRTQHKSSFVGSCW